MRELAQHVTDLVENSVRAGARRIQIELEERSEEDLVVLTVQDDGSGMPPDMVERVTDPFFTTRDCRGVGLGLPLLAASAERAGGGLWIESQPGRGTVVRAYFQASHIDTPPIGDLKGAIFCAIVGHQNVDVRFRNTVDGQSTEIDSGQIKVELGAVPLSHPSILGWLEQAVSEAVAAAHDRAAGEEETHAEAH